MYDQVDETIGYYLDQGNVSHLDKSCFFLLRNKENRSDLSHDFEGKIGIWRICVMKIAERSSKRRKRGEECESVRHRRGVVQDMVRRRTSSFNQAQDAVATFEASSCAAGRREPPHGEKPSGDS